MTTREPVLAWALAGLVGAASLAIVWTGHLRLGGYVLAGALVLAGVLRAVLPGSRAGALVVRPRWVDVILWFGLGVAVAVATWLVNIPPPGAP